MLMNVLAGHDPQDSTSSPEQVTDYVAKLEQPIKGMRIGLPREYLSEGIDAGIKTAMEAATKQLQSLGAEIVELSLPHTEQAVAVYYVLATAEASANLARFDGVRYGHRSANAAGHS